MRRLIFLAAFSLLHCACSIRESPQGDDSFQPFPEAFVKDVVPLSGDPPYRLQDIASSIVHFETGVKEVEAAINRGDSKPIETGDSWTYAGDGAQSPVRIKRLTGLAQQPLRIRVKLGPMSSGLGREELPLYIYEFERTSGGWSKLAYRREMVPISMLLEVEP